MNNTDGKVTKRQQVATRTIAAPAALIFDTWILPALVEDWWGPAGFTSKVHNLDAVVGGSFAIEMIAPSGKSCVMSGVYTNVDKPKRLEFEVHSHCNMDLPQDIEPQTTRSLVQVEFEEQQGQTRVTIYHSALNNDYSWLAAASWSESLDKLAVCVKQ